MSFDCPGGGDVEESLTWLTRESMALRYCLLVSVAVAYYWTVVSAVAGVLGRGLGSI